MHIQNIVWDRVTPFSQAVAIVLFVGVFALGFWLGYLYEYHAFLNGMKANQEEAAQAGGFTDVVFDCAEGKIIEAVFQKEKVTLILPGQRIINLPQVLSGSGARYANTDESIVFWNKGDTAFVEEGGARTFDGCTVRPEPQ